MADVEQPHVANAGPVPLSFPAVLRNPKLSDRFAHLHVPPPPQPRPLTPRREPEGKRWVRRRENAKFTHNPHAVLPTGADAAHPLQTPLSTFPHPLPNYLPRTLAAPSSHPPPSVPSASIAGLFSLSLRGTRRALRARPSSAYLVEAVEAHLATWLQGGTYLSPDQVRGVLRFPGDPVCGREDIREVGREAGGLVWAVGADSVPGNPGYRDSAFERYVVHCVARWYGVVSFSKETDGHRLTYLLRPNITRPDPRVNPASRMLDTPPTTDASDFHVSDASLSDFSATDASDIDSVSGDRSSGMHALSDIEGSRPSSPASWSVLGGSDTAVDPENGQPDERGFAASMESLSLSTHARSDDRVSPSADTTFTLSRLRNTTRAGSPDNTKLDQRGENPVDSRVSSGRDRLRTLYPRSASSPSPARRPSRRLSTSRKLSTRRQRKAKNDKTGFAGSIATDNGSFYDYLFA